MAQVCDTQARGTCPWLSAQVGSKGVTCARTYILRCGGTGTLAQTDWTGLDCRAGCQASQSVSQVGESRGV